MGKGTITANLGDYQYTIQLNQQRTRLVADYATLTARLALVETEITDLTAQITAKESEIAGLMNDLSILIGEIHLGTKKLADALPVQTEILEARGELFALQKKRAQFKLEKVSIERRLAMIATVLSDEEITAWCADATDDLTGIIGTIEPIGEPANYIIRPGYDGAAAYNAARDGQMQDALAGTPAGTFYNWALRPLWQKWMPSYRIGTIADLDKITNTCDILLDSAISADRPYGTEININQAETLSDVPIVYMNCHAQAFKDGDRVVVEFMGRDFKSPKVIGFESDPKTCGEYMVWKYTVFIGGGISKSSVIVWDIFKNCAADSLGFTNPCDYDDPDFQAWWATKTKSQNDTWFDTEDNWERYSSTVAPTVPTPPAQWEYTNIIESDLSCCLPAVFEGCDFLGEPTEESLYYHSPPCTLEGLLTANPSYDGSVTRLYSDTGKLDEITSITTHFLIQAYSFLTGTARYLMDNSILWIRTGSPDRHWWHRVQLEDLYNTNAHTGTHEKWIERFRSPFGILHENAGAQMLEYSLVSHDGYLWNRYDYSLSDWVVGWRPSPSVFITYKVNTTRSLGLVLMCRGQIATETYYKETNITTGEYYESEHVITWENRFLKAHAFAIMADEITTAEIPTENNDALSELIEQAYEYAYDLAGITDPKIPAPGGEGSSLYIVY